MRTQFQFLILFALVMTTTMLTAQPVITLQPTNLVVVGGNSATFTVAVSGFGLVAYQWQFNGSNLPSSIITTAAGNGTNRFFGEGIPATNASIYYPNGVALDKAGNLFIADAGNNRIRRVDTNGIITTVAGNGGYSSAGDGGSATSATINQPTGVAVDISGNLYIASANRIRKVNASGTITAFAGTGGTGYYGDGGLATNATLNVAQNKPCGLATDKYGTIFIADSGNNCIRKVGTNGIITTVAGNGIAGYYGENQPAISAEFASPQGVAVDKFGNLFIADTGNNRIRRVDTNGIITTVAGSQFVGYYGDGGAATNAYLDLPSSVVVDSVGNIFISDRLNHAIRRVDSNGIITTVAGSAVSGYSGDGGPATEAALYFPSGIAVDSFGNLFIADYQNSRIREVSPPPGPTLTLNNVTPYNAGYYQVVITNLSGSVTSSNVTLSVVPPSVIVITQQPQSQLVLESNIAIFSVGASGPLPLSYQWHFINPALQTTAGAVAQIMNGFHSHPTGFLKKVLEQFV